MKVSIVIPVYNVEAYIRECLLSVISQTYYDIQCVIVDDCGHDNSVAIAERIISEYEGPIEFLIVKREQNGGLSAARNTGIKAATGDYLFFLDSDDYITPNSIELLIGYAVQYPKVDIVQGNLNTDETKSWMRLDKYGFPSYSDNQKWIQEHFLQDIPVTVWNKLIRRDLVVEHNLYFAEGFIHEDEYWRLIAYSFIESIAFCVKPTYNYRIRRGSIMNDSSAVRSANVCLDIAEDVFSRGLFIETRYSVRYLFSQLLSVFKRPDSMKSQIDDVVGKRCCLLKKMLTHSNVPMRVRFLCFLFLYKKNVTRRLFERIVNVLYE